MKINQADPVSLAELWAEIEPKIKQCAFAEQAAQELAEGIYSKFTESVVLARVFLWVFFDTLPAPNKNFVENMVRSAGVAADLKTRHPCCLSSGPAV